MLPLLLKTGEQSQSGSRVSVPTGVHVRVEKNKRALWSLTAVMRELLQNATDAALLYDTPEQPVWSINVLDPFTWEWSLNGQPRVRVDMVSTATRGTTLTVTNVGAPLIMDAFMPGCYKSDKHPLVAGGHGIGLKDVLSYWFDRFPSGKMTAHTYCPHGWTYVRMEGERLCHDRVYQFDATKYARDGGYPKYRGVYTMDVTDTVKHQTTNPFAVTSGKTPKTAFVFSTGGVDINEELRAALLFHAFARPQTFLPLFVDGCAQIISSATTCVYTWPGLYYTTISDATHEAFDNWSVMLPAKQLPCTNRDRVQNPSAELYDAIAPLIAGAIDAPVPVGALRTWFELHVRDAVRGKSSSELFGAVCSRTRLDGLLGNYTLCASADVAAMLTFVQTNADADCPFVGPPLIVTDEAAKQQHRVLEDRDVRPAVFAKVLRHATPTNVPESVRTAVDNHTWMRLSSSTAVPDAVVRWLMPKEYCVHAQIICLTATAPIDVALLRALSGDIPDMLSWIFQDMLSHAAVCPTAATDAVSDAATTASDVELDADSDFVRVIDTRGCKRRRSGRSERMRLTKLLVEMQAVVDEL